MIKNISTYFLGTQFNIDIFQTLDTPNSIHIAQQAHFDRIPTLKFMLYMNNINKKNGVFYCTPGSHKWVKNQFLLPRPNITIMSFF